MILERLSGSSKSASLMVLKTKAVTVKVDKVSASAKAKIEAAGGKVEEPC